MHWNCSLIFFSRLISSSSHTTDTDAELRGWSAQSSPRFWISSYFRVCVTKWKSDDHSENTQKAIFLLKPILRCLNPSSVFCGRSTFFLFSIFVSAARREGSGSSFSRRAPSRRARPLSICRRQVWSITRRLHDAPIERGEGVHLVFNASAMFLCQKCGPTLLAAYAPLIGAAVLIWASTFPAIWKCTSRGARRRRRIPGAAAGEAVACYKALPIRFSLSFLFKYTKELLLLHIGGFRGSITTQVTDALAHARRRIRWGVTAAAAAPHLNISPHQCQNRWGFFLFRYNWSGGPYESPGDAHKSRRRLVNTKRRRKNDRAGQGDLLLAQPVFLCSPRDTIENGMGWSKEDSIDHIKDDVGPIKKLLPGRYVTGLYISFFSI